MSDFEVHPIGTTQELKLSRALSHEIEDLMQQYGRGIIPHTILRAYDKLYEQYLKNIQSENI
jgi:hypothetical protein